MPELPDVVVYVEALRERVAGHTLKRIAISGPFLLRSIAPPPETLHGKIVREVRRVGKRIALGFDPDLWMVIHLMIAGRLRWRIPGKAAARQKGILAPFEFDNGTVLFTEAGSQHRASLHIVESEAALERFNPGGIEVLDATPAQFSEMLRAENHTLKRSLTDPRLFSGIGNAYSDEILHRAGLSPLALSRKLSAEETMRLYESARAVLLDWVDRLRAESKGKFPEKVTAFRKGMAVHGRYGLPCPQCGAKIQRIRYAANETNYCPVCQTGGKLLADRGLSRLLRDDWPRSLEELDERLRG